jgi:protein NrfD
MIEFLDDIHLIWDIRVAVDQLLGAIGAGMFLASLLIRQYSRTARIAAALAPVFVTAGIAILMTELGNPVALFHVLLGNPQSVLFWGILVQGAFVVVSTLYALSLYADRFKIPFGSTLKSLSTTLVLAGGTFAVLVGLYHGQLLSDIIARPVWNNPLIPVISLVSGLTSGMAVVMALSLRNEDETGGVVSSLMQPFKWFMGGQLLMLLSMGIQFTLASPESLSAGGGNVFSRSILFWLGAITAGTLVPVTAAFMTGVGLRKKAYVIPALVLMGALAYRFVILQAGSESVVFNLPMKLIQ